MPPTPSAFLDLPPAGVTLDDLAARANAVLEAMGLEVTDGRAATRIDSRTVRFYQTIGLLPKPEYEGRRALYSLTHLLRLVAAKRLQSEGHTLTQIQNALPLRSDGQLLRALGDLHADSPNAASSARTGASRTATSTSSPTSCTRARGASSPLPRPSPTPWAVTASPCRTSSRGSIWTAASRASQMVGRSLSAAS